jgi:hypothetical protein
MKNSPARGVVLLWRSLTWLLPVACLIPLASLAARMATDVILPAPSGLRTVGIVFDLLWAGSQIVFLVLGVTAAILARRGADSAAIVVLAAICAAALSGLPPLGWTDLTSPDFNPVLAVPGFVAAGLAVLGLPLLRGGPILVLVAVAALFAVPTVSIVHGEISKAQYYANDCPPGPSMNLDLSGATTGHYTVACGLPGSGTELTGCGSGSVLVSFFDGQSVQSLDIPPWRAGATVRSGGPGIAPTLVSRDREYGGEFGWSGSYTFDSACTGQIDADLYGGPGGGSPVHVTGRFATVPVATPSPAPSPSAT